MENVAWPMGIVSLMEGVLLGLLYFGSLWWVVRRLPEISRPELWLPLSTVLRILVVLVGVYFLAGHDWKRLVAVMLGFLIGRFLVFWRVGALRKGSSCK
jgi:F1F0 ATPase subunit 2